MSNWQNLLSLRNTAYGILIYLISVLITSVTLLVLIPYQDMSLLLLFWIIPLTLGCFVLPIKIHLIALLAIQFINAFIQKVNGDHIDFWTWLETGHWLRMGLAAIYIVSGTKTTNLLVKLQTRLEQNHQNQMELQKVQLQNKVFSEAIEDAIFIIQNNRIIYSNDAARVLFNFEHEDYPKVVNLVPPESLASFSHCLKSSASHFEQINMLDGNGDKFLCDLYKVHLDSSSICLIIKDITIITAILESHEPIKIDSISSSMAHELNNQLMVILGNAELLEHALSMNKTDFFRAKGPTFVSRIQNAGNQCKQLLERPYPSSEVGHQVEQQGTLWVIDDDPELLEVIGELLDELNIPTLLIGTQKELSKAFSGHPPDQVLCDQNLSGFDNSGLVILRSLLKQWPQVTCTLMSGSLNSDLEMTVNNQGIGVLHKPFNLLALARHFNITTDSQVFSSDNLN